MTMPRGEDCPGFCEKLPNVLSEIRADIREGRVENREIRARFEEHLARIEKLCPQHESRIRTCEDDILRARTLASVIPWGGKIFYCLLGMAFSGGVYVAVRVIPGLMAQAMGMGAVK